MKRPAGEGRSVLIVDDDLDTREMYGEYLRALGLRPVMAASGAEALRAAREEPPAVVVTDLRLNGQIDGLELTRRLRGDHRTRDVRIIVLTGAGLNGEAERAAASGAHKFLLKPCLPEALAAEILRVAPTALSPSPEDPDTGAQPHQPAPRRDRQKT
jgi:CheY-like chemotaxis protein